ncbi:unnamed protein product [Lactuca virosa]|uniref:Uncharacterized protein n=1 Tax=Lactuca virosa TaxID=75947 RepID=A0AAU9LL04_9ASTR|nr:unnamed protein product [Lactuca virosa]
MYSGENTIPTKKSILGKESFTRGTLSLDFSVVGGCTSWRWFKGWQRWSLDWRAMARDTSDVEEWRRSAFIGPTQIWPPKFVHKTHNLKIITHTSGNSMDVKEVKEETEMQKAKMKMSREKIQGEELTNAEQIALVDKCNKHKPKRQINLCEGHLCADVSEIRWRPIKFWINSDEAKSEGQPKSYSLGPKAMELGLEFHGEVGAVVVNIQLVDLVVSHVLNCIIFSSKLQMLSVTGNRF